MENKIKKEHLDTIVAQQKDLNTLLTNIGMLESQKHSYLHKIADVNKAIEDFKVEMQKEYGDVNINLEDGSYTLINKKEDDSVPFEEVK